MGEDEKVSFPPGDPRATAAPGEVVEFTLPLSPWQALAIRQRCEAKEAQACSLFGLNLAIDDTVKGKRVGKFFRKACELGDSGGCLMLSQMQLRGRVPGSQASAAKNCETACRMGNMDACYHFAILTFAGIGVKQNMHQGLGLLMNICEKGGHGQSCFQAARVVSGLKNEGVWQQSEEETSSTIEMLLTKSCENKFEEGCKQLEEFKKAVAEATPANAAQERRMRLAASTGPQAEAAAGAEGSA